MTRVEDLTIYKQYLELIYYTEMILEKYPKCERFSIVTTIKNNTYEGMKYVLNAFKEYAKEDKLKNLNRMKNQVTIISFLNFLGNALNNIFNLP